MERKFELDFVWVQLLQNIVVIGCFIAYMIIPGKELIFALYIPLDIFFSLAKTTFYWT